MSVSFDSLINLLIDDLQLLYKYCIENEDGEKL